MRELTYVARRTVEWREAPDPKIQSGQEAIVAPVAATPCDVDSPILAGHGFIEPPFALGHECVAKVVETGDAVTTVAPGDLVVVPWSINCGTCDRCLGRADRALHRGALHGDVGAPIGGSWGGLFSDLVRMPYADAMLVPLPTGLDSVTMAFGQRQLVPGLAPDRSPPRGPPRSTGPGRRARQHRTVRVRHRPRARRLRRALRRPGPRIPRAGTRVRVSTADALELIRQGFDTPSRPPAASTSSPWPSSA